MPEKISLPAYESSSCYLFALGRNAMYAACGILGLKKGDEVLTPAFDCDGSLQPFRALGLSLNYFKSDPYTFAADTEDIKKKISPRTKLIHVIDHFGMPQPWDRISGIQKQYGIPVLEDCAYSLFSSAGGRLFGTSGDMAVFSLRKNLPMIDGGMLRINNEKYSFTMPGKKAPFFYKAESANVLALVKRALGYYKAPEAARRLMRRFNPAVEPPPPLYSEREKGYPDWPLRDHTGEEFTCDYLRPVSRLARRQLEGLAPGYYARVAQKKREYYSTAARKLKNVKGITILWPELPEGVVPFSLNILLEKDRDRVFEALRKRYDVMAWPTLPMDVIKRLDEFPEVELLGRKLLQINLASDKVIDKRFGGYLEKLTGELAALIS